MTSNVCPAIRSKGPSLVGWMVRTDSGRSWLGNGAQEDWSGTDRFDLRQPDAAQCCVRANYADLAVIAATLANSGVNRRTGMQALPTGCVRDVLSVMFSTGRYEFSGHWAYRVGLPSKSGLAGTLLAVIPGRHGVAVYSSPLDSNGKSARGIRVFEGLSWQLALHAFEPGAPVQAGPGPA
jgi:glutaminase